VVVPTEFLTVILLAFGLPTICSQGMLNNSDLLQILIAM
ncbi:hypothetical protein E2320_008926, partial [Naja naja]